MTAPSTDARVSRVTWQSYLLAGLFAIAMLSALPRPGWVLAYAVIQASAVVAIGLGASRMPAPARAGWLLLLGGRALWTAADAYLNYATLRPGAPLTITWGLLAPYPLLIAGLVLLAPRRRARRSAAATIDVAIFAGGACVVAWAVVTQPFVRMPGWGSPLALAYLALDALVLASLVRMVITAGTGNRAFAMVAGSGAALLTADGIYLAQAVLGGHAGQRPGSFVELSWAMCAVLTGAAALHPAAGHRVEPAGGVGEDKLSGARLAIFVLLALAVPVTALAGLAPAALVDGAPAALVDGAPATGNGLHPWPAAYLVPTLVAAAMSILLVIRLSLVTRLVGQRSSQLDDSVAALHQQDGALRDALGEQEALEKELRHRATHDPLTGLANRALFNERLTEMIEAAGSTPVSVLLLDLDGFKDVNDTLGHPAGDEVLLEVACRLRHALPHANLIARLGGDEFAMLCRPADEPIALLAAVAALASVRPPYQVYGREVHLTVSVGLLTLTDHDSAGDALRDVDLALYAAKGAGKNQVAVFQPQLRDARVRYTDLTSGLRRAVADGELTLFYQPVVDLTDGHVVAVEALLRWHPPAASAIPPVQFVPIAEETGLIVPIGRWVLTRACREARAWHERYGVALTVNVSGHQLREPRFVEMVLQTLAETGLPAQALVLELTESTLITSAGGQSTDYLHELRRRGVRVAIDDFGTGYSSLSYLTQLPVDILKIDQSFTQMSGDNARPRVAFTRAILDLAASLELTTIAEGVETASQARQLRALKCPLAQGYLYSRPVPAEEIGPLLATWNAAVPNGGRPEIAITAGNGGLAVRVEAAPH